MRTLFLTVLCAAMAAAAPARRRNNNAASPVPAERTSPKAGTGTARYVSARVSSDGGLRQELFGWPLFTEKPEERRSVEAARSGYLLAASYGAVYGMLSGDGRDLYVADAPNYRGYRFDMGAARTGSQPVSDSREQDERIRSATLAINRFYRFGETGEVQHMTDTATLAVRLEKLIRTNRTAGGHRALRWSVESHEAGLRQRGSGRPRAGAGLELGVACCGGGIRGRGAARGRVPAALGAAARAGRGSGPLAPPGAGAAVGAPGLRRGFRGHGRGGGGGFRDAGPTRWSCWIRTAAKPAAWRPPPSCAARKAARNGLPSSR